MSREEAIEQLQNCKDLIKQDGQDYLDERDFPLLDMAIKALQGDMYCPNCGVRLVHEDEYLEPTQTHDRLIDADTLMKELSDIQPYNWTNSESEIQEDADYSLFKSLINSAPTVQAEAVHKPDYSYEANMVRRLIEETLKNKLQELAQCDDYEIAHMKADELLCDFITKLGYGEVAQKFDAVPKWYA